MHDDSIKRPELIRPTFQSEQIVGDLLRVSYRIALPTCLIFHKTLFAVRVPRFPDPASLVKVGERVRPLGMVGRSLLDVPGEFAGVSRAPRLY